MLVITYNLVGISMSIGMNFDKVKYIPVGTYTIVVVKSGKGSDAGWGRLKSGAGFIALDYAKRV